MKLFHILTLVLVLLTIAGICYSCSRKITRRLLTENRVYHWKVYHIAENNFPAGTSHYFEVYYGNEQLVLPSEMTGGVRDIGRFVAAGGYDSGATDYDTILIIFESFTKNEGGFEQRGLVNISVRPESGHRRKLLVTNLNNGQSVTLELTQKKK